jgi:hypothetical protein
MSKSVSAAVVAGILLAGIAPALAADEPAPTTKSACKKHADMKWDSATKTCVKK